MTKPPKSIYKNFFFIIFFFTVELFGVVDINNATLDQLTELNGVGKTKAQKIVTYREVNQCFSSIDELSSIDGISDRLVSKNRSDIILGSCQKEEEATIIDKNRYLEVLLNPVNIVFVIIIFILAIIDQTKKKDLKSQIVSIGVLGTFVGIFIGLQEFNPKDIINSVNDILVGLKTAFFTSIIGMSVATSLSILEKLRGSSEK